MPSLIRETFKISDMYDQSALTSEKILERFDYDHAKDSNSIRTKSVEKDLEKRIEKFQTLLYNRQLMKTKTQLLIY